MYHRIGVCCIFC